MRGLQTLLANILEEIVSFLDCDGGAIYFSDESAGTAEIVCARGLSTDFVAAVRTVDTGQWPFSIVFLEKKAILADRFAEFLPDISEKHGLSSVISVPLLAKKKVIGALNMASRMPRAFTDAQAIMLESIGRAAGSVICRMRTEADLAASEARYQDLVELSPDLVAIHCEGKIVFINPAGARMMGAATPDQLIGMPLTDFVSPPRRDDSRARIEKLVQEGTPSPVYEQKILRLDGTQIDVEFRGVPFPYQGKTAVQIIGRDITAKKAAEDALRRLDLRYRTVVENANEVIIVTQGDQIRYVNPKAEQITGYAMDELLSTPFIGFIHEDDRAVTMDRYRKRMAGGRPPRISYCRYIHKSGKVRWIELRVNTIEWDGAPAVLLMISDIHEKVEAQKALQESENQLRALSARLISLQEQERQRIAGDLHDRIGQPLAGFKFSMEGELLKAGDSISPAVRELLERFVSFSRETIGDIRTLYTELRPPMLDDLGLIAAMQWLCRNLQESIPGCRILPDVNISEEDVPEDLKITIFRIMQEAMANALRHSQASRLEIFLSHPESRIELMVKDNGVGFDLKND